VATVNFPLEYHAEVVGDYEERTAATRLLLMIGAFAAIGILLLLQAAFNSWWRAGLLFASLPVSLLGGSVVASLVGGLNIATGAGLLAVLLWAARCGLSLVSRAQQLEAEGTSTPSGRPVVTAAGEHVGPLLTTALVTAGVLVPLLVMGRRPGLEVLWPMAAVILGGLLTTALTTLLLVPIVYRAGGPAPTTHEASAQPELSGAGRNA
jgi:Cu/Ag efflux pump CusA